MKNIKIPLLLITLISLNATENNIPETNEEVIKRLIPPNHQKLINLIFTKVPLYTLKIQGTYKKAKQILEILNPQTDAEIKAFNEKYNTSEKINNLVLKLKKELIQPVKQLFPLLRIKEYRFINEPLFINILLEEENKNYIKSKINKDRISLEDVYKYINEKKIPIGLKFLKSDEKTAQTFFEDFIVNKETLIMCCKEFDTLFEPLNKILTQKTKEIAFKAYQNLKSLNTVK